MKLWRRYHEISFKRTSNNLSRIILYQSLSKDKYCIVNLIGINITLVLVKCISKQRMLSLQTKNKKLKRLIELIVKNSNINNFSAPVINLLSHVLSEKKKNYLKYDLRYCFIDRKRSVKKYLLAKLETLLQQTSD